MAERKQSRPARDVVKLTDLAPRQEIKGGSQRRVFGADPIQDDRKTRETSGNPAKDLPVRSSASVKGGRLVGNDNGTLLRRGKHGVRA